MIKMIKGGTLGVENLYRCFTWDWQLRVARNGSSSKRPPIIRSRSKTLESRTRSNTVRQRAIPLQSSTNNHKVINIKK